MQRFDGVIRETWVAAGLCGPLAYLDDKRSRFRCFKTSPEIIRLAVLLYVRFPLSQRNVEDLLHVRGVGVSHKTARFFEDRFCLCVPHRSERIR